MSAILLFRGASAILATLVFAGSAVAGSAASRGTGAAENASNAPGAGQMAAVGAAHAGSGPAAQQRSPRDASLAKPAFHTPPDAPLEPCAKLYPLGALEHYLEEIRGLMVGEETARAASRLNQLDSGLLCAVQPVPSRLLGRYYFLRAIVAWRLGEEDDARKQLHFAFALFPELQWDPELAGAGEGSRAFIVAFKQAREAALLQSTPSRFSVSDGGAERQLYVDGESFRGTVAAEYEISPGRHLMQIQEEASTYRAFWKELEPGSKQTIALSGGR